MTAINEAARNRAWTNDRVRIHAIEQQRDDLNAIGLIFHAAIVTEIYRRPPTDALERVEGIVARWSAGRETAGVKR